MGALGIARGNREQLCARRWPAAEDDPAAKDQKDKGAKERRHRHPCSNSRSPPRKKVKSPRARSRSPLRDKAARKSEKTRHRRRRPPSPTTPLASSVCSPSPVGPRARSSEPAAWTDAKAEKLAELREKLATIRSAPASSAARSTAASEDSRAATERSAAASGREGKKEKKYYGDYKDKENKAHKERAPRGCF